ncbi:hypothetical protein [Bacteroides fragilis]|uniref:hypothetical protein n=1 Tax=Bacteroides fragilis TaxID=817 RepID=UPI00202F0853|nr:hypothetical protein [Bacteroides fragilis]MCM0326914.1 hypothetical protein [Bacteroides fragilis]
MKTIFVVKLEEYNSSSRFLLRNIDGFNSTIPYGFRYFQFKHEIAYFDTREEAITACEEAFKYEGTQGLPVILEAIVD